ncbi:MAG: hypothetical protein ACSLFB_10650 [Acidimicrobiales bacterium]
MSIRVTRAAHDQTRHASLLANPELMSRKIKMMTVSFAVWLTTVFDRELFI